MMSSASVPRSARSSTTTTVVVSRPPRQARTVSRARRQRRNRAVNPFQHPDLVAYTNTLSDPWRHGPVRLGFGTMVPTGLFSLNVRGFFTTGAAGEATIFLAPKCNGTTPGGVLYWTGDGASYPSAGGGMSILPWSNQAPLIAAGEEMRIVSGGLRAIPQIPGTSAPGIAYVQSYPSVCYNEVNGANRNTLITVPTLRWGNAMEGAFATVRPIDPNSFTFHHGELKGDSLNSLDYPVSTPMIIFRGLPTLTPIYVEAVLNVEFIMGATPNVLTTGDNPTSVLPRLFSSVESLWSAISSRLPAAQQVVSALSVVAPAFRPVAQVANALMYGNDQLREIRGGRSVQSSRGRLMP